MYKIDSKIVISNIDKIHYPDKCCYETYREYIDNYIDLCGFDFLIGQTARVFSKPHIDKLMFGAELLCEDEFIDIEFNGKIYCVLNGEQNELKND